MQYPDNFASNFSITLLCNIQGSGNGVFSHANAKFVNMPFNKKTSTTFGYCLAVLFFFGDHSRLGGVSEGFPQKEL